MVTWGLDAVAHHLQWKLSRKKGQKDLRCEAKRFGRISFVSF